MTIRFSLTVKLVGWRGFSRCLSKRNEGTFGMVLKMNHNSKSGIDGFIRKEANEKYIE